MQTRARFRCLSRGSLGSFLLLAACSSGQTGSPVSEDPTRDLPPYQTPGRRDPERPGGGTNEGGSGTGRPEAVPRPTPRPGSTALLGDTLVVADRGVVVFLDVSTPSTPRVVGHAELSNQPGAARWEPISATLLKADALDRVVVSVTLEPHASEPALPTAIVPRSVQELWLVDGSNPSAPRIVSRTPVPTDALELAIHGDGYTALGARVASQSDTLPSAGCGSGLLLEDLPSFQPTPEISGLWLERVAAQGSSQRRELAGGYWNISSDQSHAVRIGLPAHTLPTGSFEVELVSLSTLETVFRTTLTPADLGTPLSAALGADFADGVLIVAGGSRLLGFDVASGSALPAVVAAGRIESPRFLDSNEIVLEGGGAALASLDRSGATPALSLVSIAPGTPLGGPLMRFGDGYLALEGTPEPTQLLRATSYRRDDSGTLVLVDQLQTNWFFRSDYDGTRPWHVDSAAQRVTYARPDRDGAGFTSMILGNQGQLTASASLPTPAVAPALLVGDTLLGFSEGRLQPLQLDDSASPPALSELPVARTVALADVRLEVQHAGLIWSRHRKDTGETSLSVRAGEYGEPTHIELPHAVDTILPIDPTHVAVFGFSVTGLCDTWRDTNPDFAFECRANAGNGLSVVAIAGGQPRVTRSLPLSSFLEGRPPTGIEQSIDWLGYLPVGPGKWALWGDMQQRCGSAESCAELGVPAYTSYGVSGCSSGQTCSSETLELISGQRSESWLFPLDLSDPDAPSLQGAVRAGAQLTAGGELGADLGPQLLGYDAADGHVWGYAVDEPVYGTDGNSVFDAAGHGLHRWYLQLVDDRSAEPRFGARVSVPGQAVLVGSGALAGGSAEHTAFTLQPRFDGQDHQSLWLERTRIEDNVARVDTSLELGPNAIDARGVGDWIAVLSGPADYCAADGQYELRVVDTRSATLRLSAALQLPAPVSGWGWGLSRSQSDAQLIQLGGGPAAGGVLTIDPSSDPPLVIGYEY